MCAAFEHWLYYGLLTKLNVYSRVCVHCPSCLGPRHTDPCEWHLVAKTGDLFKLVHLRTSPSSLTSGDCYWRTYSWRAGGTHPTGMIWQTLRVSWCQNNTLTNSVICASAQMCQYFIEILSFFQV